MSIDSRLESYRGYLGNEIFKKQFENVNLHNGVKDLLQRLLLEIRAHSYAASMSGFVAGAIESYNRGYAGGGSASHFFRSLPLLMSRLKKEVPQLVKQPRVARKLERKLAELASAYYGMDKKIDVGISAEDVWIELQKEYVFLMGVWSSQRLAFLSSYNAYDNFMAGIVGLKLSMQSCRTTSRKFPFDLKEAFGENIAQNSWLSENAMAFREIRNSLSHAAGRVTENLRKLNHGVLVQNKYLQIWPGDIKRLYDHIVGNANLIADSY